MVTFTSSYRFCTSWNSPFTNIIAFVYLFFVFWNVAHPFHIISQNGSAKQNQYTSATVSLMGAKTLTLLCHFNIRTRTTIAGSDLPSQIYSSLMRCFHWSLMLYQGRWCSALPLLLFLLWYVGFYAMETQQQIFWRWNCLNCQNVSGDGFWLCVFLFWPCLHPRQGFDQRKPDDGTRQRSLHPESKVYETDSRWWLLSSRTSSSFL